MARQWKLKAARGRIRIGLYAARIGADLQVLVCGGRRHIGAIALATPGDDARVIGLAGHREGELAGELAGMLARELDCAVAVTCGIHYDDITAGEIKTALELAKGLALDLLRRME